MKCKCIRSREAGLKQKSEEKDIKLTESDYDSSGGKEVFLSFEDEDESIYGFLRLRKPSDDAHRDEVKQLLYCKRTTCLWKIFERLEKKKKMKFSIQDLVKN